MKISLEWQRDNCNYLYEVKVYSYSDDQEHIIQFQNTYNEAFSTSTFFVTDFLLIDLADQFRGFIKAYELIDIRKKSYRSHLIDLNLNPSIESFEGCPDMRELAI